MKIALTIAAMLLAMGCTENVRAKAYGESMTVKSACDQKIIDVTWKGSSLWYATVPMTKDDKPRTVRMKESSSYGLVEGTVLFRETRCN
jgi:hypothetical protein